MNSTSSEPAGAATLPASFGQERLWFLHRSEPASTAYNVALAFDLEGEVNLAALEQSFLDVVRRHEVLRTTVEVDNGELLQVINDEARCPFSVIEAPAAEHATLAREWAQHVFDLEKGPLLRVAVLPLGHETFRLLLNVHHIVFDGWSVGVLLHELAAHYRARSRGTVATLDPLPIQYGDFAVWQRDWLDTPPAAQQLAFWKRQLAELPPPLELPTDTPLAESSTTGADYLFELPSPLVAELRAFCSREKVTLFMLLSAGFQAVLHRYTRADAFLIGTPVANRSAAEVAELIGFFVNTVVLRADFGGDPSGRELLRRVREDELGALANAELPFEKLVQELHPDRTPGGNPLFRTLFALQSESPGSGDFAGLKLRPHPLKRESAMLDLLLEISEEAGALHGCLSYRTALFRRETIVRFAAHLTNLLRGLVRSPETRISALPLLDEDERAALLSWSRNERPFPSEKTVHALFAEQVDRGAERIAVIDGTARVTYGELHERSAGVTQWLRARGVERGDRVGVPAERTTRFLAAILGTIRAGAAYVPIDPKESGARAEAIRRSCRLMLDWSDDIASSADPAEPLPLAPNDAAYVLYTSGSTGEPKGVVVPHRAIVRLVCGSDYVALREDDVVALASNLSFDAATFEIWGALLNGATVVLTPTDILLDPRQLAAHLVQHRITTLFLTTALFNQMAHVAPAMFRPLRQLLFGGELVDARSVRRVVEHGKPQRLLHVYGPTETTTFATWHEVQRVEGDHVPIGRPIANTTAFILDRGLMPVPIGVVGEIYIGGPGLALGYQDAPELTATRFVETPYGRLYKTGDLGRWLPEGAIDYAGRVDQQIKLRGFRIEPGEIEAALGRHPGVRHATVTARQVGGEKVLVAYVVGAVPAVELRETLRQHLPAHMVPAVFVPLEALPLTANGKVDHRAFPEPNVVALPVAESIPPRSQAEKALAALWAEVLGRNRFSVQDNFFDAGGHSLLAIRLLARVREEFGVEVPVSRLFEAPTLEGMARLVSADRIPEVAAAGPQLVAIQRGDATREPVFLVPGGGGGEAEFLVYAQLARHIDPRLPLYGVRTAGGAEPERSQADVAAIATEYLALVRARHPHGPYVLWGECVGGMIAYEMARQLDAAGERLKLLLLLDTEWPTPDALRAFNSSQRAQRWDEVLGNGVTARVREHWGKISRLSTGERFRYVWQRLRHGPQREQVHYARAIIAHQPAAWAGKVTLVLSERATRENSASGWQAAHGGVLEIHEVPGDHFSYIREHARATGAKLRELLQAAGPEPLCE